MGILARLQPQDVVWEIEVATPPPYPLGSPLTSIIPERQCVPLRPGYAVDLRDDALAAVRHAGVAAWCGVIAQQGRQCPQPPAQAGRHAFHASRTGRSLRLALQQPVLLAPTQAGPPVIWAHVCGCPLTSRSQLHRQTFFSTVASPQPWLQANVSVADKLVTLSVGFGLLTPNNTPLGNSSAFYSFGELAAARAAPHTHAAPPVQLRQHHMMTSLPHEPVRLPLPAPWPCPPGRPACAS